MADLKTIKFSKNWNKKLDNEIFTTIRKKGFYVNHGDNVAIVLNDKLYKWVTCIGKNEIPFINICGSIIACDTGLIGMDAIQTFEQLGINTTSGTEECCLLVLKSIPRPGAFTHPEAHINLKLNI
jgi:hypothetical protein